MALALQGGVIVALLGAVVLQIGASAGQPLTDAVAAAVGVGGVMGGGFEAGFAFDVGQHAAGRRGAQLYNIHQIRIDLLLVGGGVIGEDFFRRGNGGFVFFQGADGAIAHRAVFLHSRPVGADGGDLNAIVLTQAAELPGGGFGGGVYVHAAGLYHRINIAIAEGFRLGKGAEVGVGHNAVFLYHRAAARAVDQVHAGPFRHHGGTAGGGGIGVHPGRLVEDHFRAGGGVEGDKLGSVYVNLVPVGANQRYAVLNAHHFHQGVLADADAGPGQRKLAVDPGVFAADIGGVCFRHGRKRGKRQH